MAYIESHQSLPRHPKTMRAVELLGMDRHKFLGHLNCMWLWALDYADIDGNLPPTVTVKVLGAAAEVDHKQAQKFVNSLLNAGGEGREGFLTWNGEHFILHDWFDFAGRLIAKRVSNRERMRSARGGHVQRTDDARSSHVQGPGVFLSQGTVPNRTVPSASASAVPPTPLIPPATDGGGEVFKKWETEIGVLTPMIAEEVGTLIDEQGETRVLEAIDIAVTANARSLRYVRGIFERAGKGPLQLPRKVPPVRDKQGQPADPEKFNNDFDRPVVDRNRRIDEAIAKTGMSREEYVEWVRREHREYGDIP